MSFSSIVQNKSLNWVFYIQEREGIEYKHPFVLSKLHWVVRDGSFNREVCPFKKELPALLRELSLRDLRAFG